MNEQTRKEIEENRDELEALAESDNPAAPIARVILSLD